MFDLNAIVTAALNAAIQAATEPLITRIAALESANDILHRAQGERIAALENNPAIGVDTTLERRITALEGDISHKVQVQQANIVAALAERIEKLENNPAGTPATITADAFVTHLDNQEWFWEKLIRKAGEAAEAAIEEHTSTYDHDEYDSHIGDDDKHFDGDIEDAVRDALSNMSFDISIR